MWYAIETLPEMSGGKSMALNDVEDFRLFLETPKL